MFDLELDFSKTKDFDTLENGSYVGTVTSVETKMNDNGVLQLWFKLKIDGKSFNSRKFNIDGKDNNFFLKDTLQKMGLELKDKVKLSELDVKGTKVEVEVSEREWNDKKYTNIDIVKGLGKEEGPF